MHPLLIVLVGVAFVLGGILVLRLHAFIALVLAALAVATLTPTGALRRYAQARVWEGEWSASRAERFVSAAAPERVAEAFGATCGQLGILIAMAAVIGRCMLESGAADRIVRTALRWLGEARAGLAFVASGFVLGIPVFFDTVFYLMIPLAKAVRVRTGANYLLYVLTIVAGATMAHSLVPPTPGPLLVAESLGIPLGTMILVGCLIGLVSSSVGYGFACWLNRRFDVPLRATDDVSLEALQGWTSRDESQLPPTWLSLLPILLPVGLIASQAVAGTFVEDRGGPVAAWIRFFGNKNAALVLGAAIALFTLAWQKRAGPKQLARSVESALASGGVIVLITAAGGAFGSAIRQSGVAETMTGLAHELSPLWALPVAFLITALVRTAQGSATVAMITAVGLLQPMADPAVINFHPVYLAMAIGCGSKPLSWMNDSGFWVICRMSGLRETEGLQTITPMTAVMGVAGLVATVLAAWLVPLAP